MLESLRPHARHARTALLGVMALGGALIGCEENTYVPPPPPEVGVSTPLVQEVTRYADLTGRTEAVQVVEVRARVEGILLESLASAGERVQHNEVLFRIDPEEFIAARDAAAARVQRAEAALQVAQVRLDKVERAASLEAVTELEVLEAQADVEMAAADLEVARRELAIKQLSVDYTDVRAPLTGELEAGAPDIGSLVGGLNSGRLTRIFDTSKIYVWMTMPDRVFLRTAARENAPGDPIAYPVEIATEADEGYPHAGTIDYLDPSVDPETGTIRVRATVDNADGTLRPGLFVRARIVAEQLDDAVLVPEAAIGSGQIGRYVMVVRADGVVESRPVTLGPRSGALRVIESGLDANDRVVVRGLLRARPGQPVTAVEERIDTNAAGMR